MKFIGLALPCWLLFAPITAFSQTEVVLQINHKMNGSPFVLDQTYEVDSSQLQINRLQYYMCDFVVTHDGGQETTLNDTYILVDAGLDGLHSLGQWDIESIEALSFGIGVDSEHNVGLDPTTYPLGHPLGPVHPSMHWGWAAGYRFLALEGYSGTNLDAQSQVHALGDNNFFHQTHAIVGEAFNGALSLSLDANYEYMFEGLPVSEGFFVHGSTGIASETMVNMRDLVFEAGAPTSIVDITANTGVQLFPNPATERINLSMQQIASAKHWVIYNSEGKPIMKGKVNAQAISVQELQYGSYHMVLLDARGMAIQAHRFVKL